MASVPSIGCLLAKNQYYRKASISSVSSLTDSVNIIPDDKSQQGLPKVEESSWWFKSFFHSEPVLSDVRGKDLSASGYVLSFSLIKIFPYQNETI
ncbi:pancreatic progenitor cell differentiation and proliferation factor-like protein [Zalophus californianus]|uniref:Pancreatic progenitor cell differentiation and proliferation factor-like protein n=1 Tax=Zalophus californianus TaxID=9704 RepID=A0A6J2DKH4_ZALCA|nr:pancreatic progenitor cell differentiation and proliferation factor-like protein [Zalophus californianus]XP_027974799.1 pancreatic progenitor cell differentiation and proliferation factor-like protein [Eumetopias jubatus]